MEQNQQIRITWNGLGGELESVVVVVESDDRSVTAALIKLVSGNIVSPGDSFIIEEI